ncbi:TPD1 protein homolog 1B-like [Lolium rigidum]|uniref:TPD1 protein homolog 1B-like n=1 Tax=Lolium rigidum TaxID=89674 RepID=UPI001F5C2119|nr:TPD1 protein homolog 1B-like [Lolium rigidum]
MGCSHMRSLVGVVVTMLLLLACCEGNYVSASSSQQLQQRQHHPRKMLDVGGAPSPSDIVIVHGCSDPEELMHLSQSRAGSTGGGMPEYTVEITNTCLDCNVCNVHLSCGDFASTELVDPATFRRLAVNDCLVNNGGPIGPGELITFHYANSFIYDMKVKSASCKCA